MPRKLLEALGLLLAGLLFFYLTFTYGSSHDGWWFQEMFNEELTAEDVSTLAASVVRQRECEVNDHGRVTRYAPAQREALMGVVQALLTPIVGKRHVRAQSRMDDDEASERVVFGESGQRQRVSVIFVPEGDRWRIARLAVEDAD